MIVRGVLLIFGFFAGALPFGVLIARALGVDIRQHGSGNIGATNVTRVLGVVPGAVVLVLDALKGAIPTFIAIRSCGEPWIVVSTGGMAILGHCFSPFLEFRGGKGVATALGVFVVLSPQFVAISLLAFVAMLQLTKVPAIGSLASAATIATLFILDGFTEAATLAVATFALLIYTHRTNIAKLRRS